MSPLALRTANVAFWP